MGIKVAFVMINTQIGEEQTVLNSIKKIPEVKEVHLVFGVYDLVVKVECKGTDDLKRIILDIRTIKDLQATVTIAALPDHNSS